MPAAVYIGFNIWSQEAGAIPLQNVSVGYDEWIGQRAEITTGTTDSSLAFGAVGTADVIVLESSQAITLNINSDSGTDITVDADKPVVFAGTSITALYVSNSSGSTAVIRYWLWGT